MDPDWQTWDWRHPATTRFSFVIGNTEEANSKQTMIHPSALITDAGPLPMGVGGPVLTELAELVKMVEATTEAAKLDIEPSVRKKLLPRDPSVFKHMGNLSTHMEILRKRAANSSFFQDVDARRVILCCDTLCRKLDEMVSRLSVLNHCLRDIILEGKRKDKKLMLLDHLGDLHKAMKLFVYGFGIAQFPGHDLAAWAYVLKQIRDIRRALKEELGIPVKPELESFPFIPTGNSNMHVEEDHRQAFERPGPAPQLSFKFPA